MTDGGACPPSLAAQVHDSDPSDGHGIIGPRGCVVVSEGDVDGLRAAAVPRGDDARRINTVGIRIGEGEGVPAAIVPLAFVAAMLASVGAVLSTV